MHIGNIYLKSILSLLLLTSAAASHSSFEHSHARRSLSLAPNGSGGLARRQGGAINVDPLVKAVNGVVDGVGDVVDGVGDVVDGE
jgi:hypothetical protein